MPNLVAWDCGGDGVVLQSGAFDLAFATVHDCDGVGIRKNTGHTGTLTSSIAFGNAGGEVAGYAPGEVRFSNVGPAFDGADGNIDADPEFVEPASGDLRLGPTSPCLGAAEVLAADAVVADHGERSRRLDHELSGVALPDMGAFERAVWELELEGTVCPGETIALRVTGPPGVATLTLGAVERGPFADPFGFDRIAPPERVIGIDVPVGQAVVLRLPEAAPFPPLAAQAEVSPPGDGSVGNLSQPIRLRFPAEPGTPIGPQ